MLINSSSDPHAFLRSVALEMETEMEREGDGEEGQKYET